MQSNQKKESRKRSLKNRCVSAKGNVKGSKNAEYDPLQQIKADLSQREEDYMNRRICEITNADTYTELMSNFDKVLIADYLWTNNN